MKDRWGVPDNLFGEVPEDFYGLVGRIVMVATLVEDRLLGLLWAIDDEPQPTHAGKSLAQLDELIRRRLLPIGGEMARELESLLVEVQDGARRRNVIVHSLWPNPTTENARGWRPRRLPKSIGGGSEIVWTEASQQTLVEDLHVLLRLSERLAGFAARIHAWKGQNTSGTS